MAKNKPNFKYNEDTIIREIKDYIESTYSQHYVGKKEVQTIDVWDSMGIVREMCAGTSLKYMMRFGKKGGKNKKDILKLIHYAILLYHFEFMSEED